MILTTFLKHIGNDESGATAIEYGLIISLVVIAMTGALIGVADANTNKWSDVQGSVEDVMGD